MIFDKEDRILLCKRTDIDRWNMPGGAMELGESPWEAAIRETKEEVGVDVEVDRLFGVYSKIDDEEVGFAFLCTIVGGELACSDEACDIQYFHVGDLPKNISRFQVERIKDALEYKKDRALLKIQRR